MTQPTFWRRTIRSFGFNLIMNAALGETLFVIGRWTPPYPLYLHAASVVTLVVSIFLYRWTTSVPHAARSTRSFLETAPVNAEFLFYLFITSENCDALVGDLEERYRLIRRKFGQRRADFWYWTQALRSVGPIVWAWMKKSFAKPFVAVAGWAIAKGILGHDSWLAALVEVWRRIRS